ncbi:hypothetical protein ABZW11_26595 [Nonomuraea sp. NPDC004580]|uniref:hypothetical protein n=1 Tax=Nonomuraea sp. NPDC004580 TaxID=3154552 RepID=UPI0033B221C7
MATRHNTCVNPALANNVDGWGGGSTPTRTAVSGFDRPFAARYTSGTFATTARGAVTPSAPATLSVYGYFDVDGIAGGVTYIEWRRGDNSVITYSPSNFNVPGRSTVRLSNTATAPADAAYAALIVEFGFASGAGDLTMVLTEAGTILLPYFDGDSDDAVWDGTPGSSSSTLPDVTPAELAAGLPPLDAAFAAHVAAHAALVAALPPLTASATGDVEAVGHLDASLPPLAAALTGVADVQATLAGSLPALAAAMTGTVTDPPEGVLAAALPALTATLTGTSDATPPAIPDVTVGPPRLRQPAGPPRLGAVLVGPPRIGGA